MMNRNKKFAAFFMAVSIAVNLFPVAVIAEETVVIATVNDFKSFTEKCVYDEYSKNKTFVLQNDIDLKNSEIEPAEVFCGYFEGGGHTIKNINIKPTARLKDFSEQYRARVRYMI